MPPIRQTKPPAPTRESVWFVVVLGANTLTKTCTYFWNEGRLVTQRVLLPSGFYEDDWYFYDESGSPYGFNFTNSNNESGIRYFVRNLQGDIVEAYGNTGAFGASHKYDAWGAVTETVLGSSTNAANFQYGYIFGYRGYQYDKETGLYYCQSRYYNPRVGRFVSADKYFDAEYSETPLTSNVWAYAENNPVNLGDHDGESATAIILGLIAVGALLTAGGCAAQSKEPPAKNTTTSATTNAPKATTTAPGIKSTKAYKNLYKKISNAKVDNKAALLNRAEVEIVARVIYGENNKIGKTHDQDRAAIARVIINRKAVGTTEFYAGSKNTYKNVVSKGFNALNDPLARSDFSKKQPAEWEQAKHLAVLVCLNKKNEINATIKNQRFFRTTKAYKDNMKKDKSKEWIYMGTNKNGKKAYFEVTNKKTLTHIFFDYKNNSIN